MALTFEQSRDAVAQLAKRYRTNQNAYRAAAYKEAHVRQDFIDHVFVALGWDVHNTQRATPDYVEVTFEGSIRDRRPTKPAMTEW